MSKVDEIGVALRDSSGRYLYANDVFAALLGHTRASDVIGQTNASLLDPATAGVLDREDAEVLASNRASETEREVGDAEGRRTLWLFRKFPFAFDGIQLVCCCAEKHEPTVIPITEQARARFFSAVSHDLRSPLNAIVGYTQLLQHENDPQRFQEAVAAIGEGSRQLLSAVDGLMTLFGPEQSAKSAKIETFNLAEATVGVAESFAAAAAENSVELWLKQGELPLVEFAGAQYLDVLNRLLDYAIHRTVSGDVTVRTTYKAGVLQTAVTDSGRRLSDSELARLLDPAAESEASEKVESATLSLSVAKRIVERLHGDFDVRNEDDPDRPGVTVTITFTDVPVTDVRQREEFARTQKIRTMRIEDPFRFDKRILLVDDRAVNLRILSLLLGAIGFKNVVTAQSGEKAVELLKTEKFGVVLTDLMMPGMDGRELLRAIRRLPGCEKLPVYAVTADTSAPVTCANDGFAGILIKPVTKETLKEVL